MLASWNSVVEQFRSEAVAGGDDPGDLGMAVAVVSRGALFTLLLIGCASPEADRERGGHPGADPGNRDAIVEIHEGSEPYHKTPCRMPDVECPEPRD